MTTYVVSGGVTISNLVVGPPDTTTVLSGGTTMYTLLEGVETVLSGGVADGSYVSAGGTQCVNGGVATSTTVAGMMVVGSGGAAFETTISGGTAFVSSGGTTTGVVISNGLEAISSGATAVSVTVEGYSFLDVHSGGSAIGVTVNSGGGVGTEATTVLSELIVNSGGSAYIDDAQSRTTINGGVEYLYSAGVETDATVTGHGGQYVYSSGLSIDATFTNGSYQVVSTGGVASGAQIGSGASQSLNSGGSAYSTDVTGGGSLYVYSAAVETNATVQGGGFEYISQGGVAISTTLLGGAEYVYSAGRAVSVMVDGGSQTVFSGGSSLSTTVSSGGVEIVSSGGTAISTTIATGGTLDLDYSAASADIFFTGPQAILSVEGDVMPTATISGFASSDGVELTSFLYSSTNTFSVSGNVLTVSHGANVTDTLVIDGASVDHFALDALPYGGTLITLVPPPPTLVIPATSDTGIVGDGFTDIATPTLSGAGVAGDAITLFDGSTPVGSATVESDDSWTASVGTLALGAHSFTAIDTDPYGDVSPASAALALAIVPVLPTAPSLALTVASDSGAVGDGITDIAAPTIAGGGAAGDVVTLFDGETAIGAATVGPDGTWSIAGGALALGAHSLTAVEMDGYDDSSPVSAPLPLTVVAAPAAAFGLALAPASDSGLSGDGVTDIATPVITGDGAAGDTIALFDRGAQVGTARVGDDGTWSMTTALAVGAHSLTAVQTDPYGDVAPASAALALAIVPVPPTAPSLALTVASDSGAVGDGITDIAAPTIAGGGAAGDVVTLFDGETAIGAATVGPDGTWSIAGGALALGAHSLTAVEIDGYDDSSPVSAPLPLTVVAAPAAAFGLALAPASDSGLSGDGVTDIATPVITGDGAAGDTIALFDRGAQVGTARVGDDGTWSTTTALAVGAHSLTAVQTDPYGDVAPASAALALAIVPVPPTAPSLALTVASDSGAVGDGITDIAAPTIAGGGAAGDVVTLFDGETAIGAATVGPDGTWSIAGGALALGAHSLTAVEIDGYDDSSPVSAPLPLTVVAAPAAAFGLALAPASDSGLSGDGVTDIATPVITGDGAAGDTIALFDRGAQVGTARVGDDGTWSMTTALAVGAHSLTAVQTDPYGDVAPASAALALAIVPVPPTAPSLALTVASDSGAVGDGITDIAAPTIAGGGAAGDVVTLFDGETAIGAATVGPDGTWSIAGGALALGAHSLTAVEIDGYDDSSPVSAPLPLTVVAAPAAAFGLALAPASDSGLSGDGVTDIATPVITGDGAAGDTIALFDRGAQVGTARVGDDGTWSTTTALAVGAHSLTAVQTDPYGDVAPASAALALAIVPVPPTAPSLALTVASDSGAVGDGITDIAAPTIAGGGAAGDVVTLFDGETAIGAATVGPDGTWSIAGGALALGAHSLTAVEIDGYDDSSPVSAPLPLTVVAAPAAAFGLALAPASDSGLSGDGVTDIATPVITGDGAAGDTIALFDRGAQVGTARVGDDGTWSTTTALAVGAHSLTAVQTDPYGDVAPASAALALAIVPVPPTAPSLALTVASDSGAVGDGITDIAAPTIAGGGAAGDVVTLFDGETAIGAATVGPDGTWSIAGGALALGAHSLTAVEIDGYDDSSPVSAPLPLTVVAAPAAAFGLALAPASDSGLSGDGVTDIATPVITGDGAAGDTIALFDRGAQVGTARVGDDGTWSMTTALAVGAHSLTAVQTDPYGDVAPASAALALAIVAPTALAAPTLTDDGDATGPAEPVVSGMGPALTTITLYDGGAAVGATTVSANGSWTYGFSDALADGTHVLTAIATDAAGDVSPLSALLDVTVATDRAYTVTTQVSGDAQARTYDASGDLTEVTLISQSGLLLQDVTATTAIRNIYDSNGTLIGTITQSSIAPDYQPEFGTSPETLASSSSTSTAGSLITLLSETNVLTAAGDDTVNAVSGADTVYASGAMIVVQAGPGTLVLMAVSGVTSVSGGTGTSTVFGGSGGGMIVGGSAGNNVLVAGGGNTTLIGGGAGDVLVAGSGSAVAVMQAQSVAFGGEDDATIFGAVGAVAVGGDGNALMIAGAGNESFWSNNGSSTLFGGTGNDVLAASGTGQTVMIGGAGNTVFIGGAGMSSAFGGTGDDVFFTGSGGMDVTEGRGSDVLLFLSGDATVAGGTGADFYGVVDGGAGGTDIISGFKLGTDKIGLFGYANDTVQGVVSSGNTVLSLSDGTTIILNHLSVTNFAALF